MAFQAGALRCMLPRGVTVDGWGKAMSFLSFGTARPKSDFLNDRSTPRPQDLKASDPASRP